MMLCNRTTAAYKQQQGGPTFHKATVAAGAAAVYTKCIIPLQHQLRLALLRSSSTLQPPDALCPAGWVGGIFILLLFYVITLWSSLMLAECQETNGVKHPTYRAAVLHVLGEQQQQQQQQLWPIKGMAQCRKLGQTLFELLGQQPLSVKAGTC
jgi:hypothetical protein